MITGDSQKIVGGYFLLARHVGLCVTEKKIKTN